MFNGWEKCLHEKIRTEKSLELAKNSPEFATTVKTEFVKVIDLAKNNFR